MNAFSVDDLKALRRARVLAAAGEGRRLRQEAGLRQTEVASAIGVDAPRLCRWEHGERPPTGAAGVRYGRLLAELEGSHDRPTA